jgi:hypothetical protein
VTLFPLSHSAELQGEDKGGIKEEGQGSVGAEESWGGDEWSGRQVDRNRYTHNRKKFCSLFLEGKKFTYLTILVGECYVSDRQSSHPEISHAQLIRPFITMALLFCCSKTPDLSDPS